MNTIIHNVRSWLGRPLSCKEVNHFILEYLEENLPSRTTRLFEKHIERCPSCETYFRQYQQTVELLREQGEEIPDPPDKLVEMTMAFLQKHLNGHGQAN